MSQGRRTHRLRVVARTCLGLVLALGIRPARAAFEIRPVCESSSPLLPGFLPAALASAITCPASGRAGWSLAALHVAPEPAAGLDFDAAGVRLDRRRWALRTDVTRLGLPGYAEWEADLCVVSKAGLALEASAFRVQPSDLVRVSAGIEPRGAASLGLSATRSFGRRMALAGWVRDLVGAGRCRALGIAPRAGGRLDLAPARGWTASVHREWGGQARPRTRVTLAWQPWSGWRLEHRRGPGAGGESNALKAELGDLELLAWSGRLAVGVPATPGFAVGYRQRQPETRAAAPARPAKFSRGAGPGRVELPSAGESWEDWEREPGEDLILIDGRVVPAGSDADSLGAWVDSLEDGSGGGRAREVSSPDQEDSAPVPMETVARGGAGLRLRMVPWSRLRAGDIPVVAGADVAARERFLEAVRTDGPRALANSLVATPDSVLRRLLLATAPYASGRDASGRGWFPSLAGNMPVTRPAVRWRREVRSSGGGPVRASDRWEFHSSPFGIGMHTAGRRPAGTELRRGSWTARLDGRGALLASGRGSPPLTWGTGLWLRSRTLEVRSARSLGGAASEAEGDVGDPAADAAADDAMADSAADAGGGARDLAETTGQTPRSSPAVSRRRGILALSSSGTDRFVAAQVPLGAGGSLVAAMRSRDQTWMACEMQATRWTGGFLAGVGGAGKRFDALVSTMSPGGTHLAEVGFEEQGPAWLALRSVGITSIPGRARAWWDLEARTMFGRTRSPGSAAAPGGETSPERRLRLRGTLAGDDLQAGAAIDAWSEGGAAAAMEARRSGRSLQLRTVARRLSLGSLTLRATGTEGRTVRVNDGERGVRTARRLRLHATADGAGAVRRAHAGAGWLLDAAYDRRESRAAPSSGAGRSLREGWWLGLAARVRCGARGEATLGALDVGVPEGGTLVVTPGWSGGSGTSAARGGLWMSGRVRWRVACVDLECKGAWPVFPSCAGKRPACPSWSLACGAGT
jgi:hypothetical protein